MTFVIETLAHHGMHQLMQLKPTALKEEMFTERKFCGFADFDYIRKIKFLQKLSFLCIHEMSQNCLCTSLISHKI